MTTLFLRIYRGDTLVGMRQFQTPPIVIGSGPEVNLKLEDSSIAPTHTMIEQRDSNYYVVDLGSEMGTLKNDKRTLEDILQSGDVLQIGPFRVEFHVGLPKTKDGTSTMIKALPPETPTTTPPVQPPPVPTPQAKAEAGPQKTQQPQTQNSNIVRPPASTQPATKKPVQTPTGTIPTVQKTTAAKPAPGVATSGGLGLSATQLPVAPKYVPPGQKGGRSLRDVVRPSKGTTVEVIVGWKDTIINTYHFSEKKIVTVGPHPKNDIILPILNSNVSSVPILKLDQSVHVFVPAECDGELTRGNGSYRIQDLIIQGKLTKSNNAFVIQLQQDELIRVDYDGGVSLFIRYVAASPKPMILPWLELTTGELLTLVGGGIVMLVAASLIQLVAPLTPPDEPETKQEEPIRRAHFQVKRREKVEMGEETKAKQEQGGSPVPDAAKQAQVQNVPLPNQGKPAEAKPNTSKSTEKKVTGSQVGKTGSTMTAKNNSGGQKSTAPKEIDVRKTGILSVFGRSGTQSEVQKALSGAEAVGGIAQGAGGKSGTGLGDNPNATEPGLKSVGAGGTGTATIGISGVKTAGRGGGTTGYGDDASLGGKKNSKIVAGGAEEAFTGTIDREAIRRVVKANSNQLKACYERALNRDPGLYGKIVLEWTIGDHGRVLEARVKTSTMNNSEVEQCCVSRLKSWRFPEPPPNQEALVAYPFTFNKD